MSAAPIYEAVRVRYFLDHIITCPHSAAKAKGDALFLVLNGGEIKIVQHEAVKRATEKRLVWECKGFLWEMEKREILLLVERGRRICWK